MKTAPRIVALGTATPPNRYSQREIYDISTRYYPKYRDRRIEQIFMSSDIEYRHLAFDKETFVPFETADELHARFSENAVPVAAEAIRRCLEKGGMSIQEIDYIVAVTCTGYLCPGLSALLIKELGMRTDLQRADLVGMGCAGAMPGLQRGYDYVMAYPERKALVVTVEICSACYYVDDSLETVVGNAICADGAAAVVLANDLAGTGPSIARFETLLEPSYIDTVGFQFKSGMLRIVLSKDIRDNAGGLAESLINTMLKKEGISQEDVRHWIIHSGGRKVIDSIKKEAGLSEEQLKHSRCILRNFGNMSSPTVLFVLNEVLTGDPPRRGDIGVMLAMGPGLAIEGAVLRW
jgi:3,5-dihydroxyphenylacetyl-CoA synthase